MKRWINRTDGQMGQVDRWDRWIDVNGWADVNRWIDGTGGQM